MGNRGVIFKNTVSLESLKDADKEYVDIIATICDIG